MDEDFKIFIGNTEDLRERVISGTDTNVEIYNCLMLLSKSVGEKITEYH